MQRSLACLLPVATLLAGCVGLGWRFGPGFSMRERRDLFAEPPVVEHRGQAYLLTWTQGDNPFFFEPRWKYAGFLARLGIAKHPTKKALLNQRPRLPRRLRLAARHRCGAGDQAGSLIFVRGSRSVI
jgi:hypothetical protein